MSIDSGILNVALPTLVRDLGATPAELQWIIDAYTLVFAGLLLTSGALGDRFGRKPVMFGGLAVFGVASLAAMTSTSPAQLVVWRAVLGIGAALIMPATLSILVTIFTDPAERRRAIAYWSLMNAVGAFFGPVTGGLLLRYFSWRACFFVNVPVVVAALFLGRQLLPNSKDPDSARFDLLGALLSSGALAALLWSIIEGPERGWSDGVVMGGFVLSVVLALGFVMWEGRVAAPMLDLAIFREPQLTAAAAAMTISFLAMTGAMFLTTQSLQLVKGYTPLLAALASSGPIVTMNFVIMPRTPRLMARVGSRWLICGGSCAVAAASFTISRTTIGSGYANLFVGFAVMAIGFSIFVPASTEAIMTAVPADKAGSASSINQLVRQVGQALGVAVCGSIAASRYTATFPASRSGLSGSPLETARDSITGAIGVARDLSGAASTALLQSARIAFLNGLRWATMASAILAVLAAVLGAVLIPGRHVLARHARGAGNDRGADDVRGAGNDRGADDVRGADEVTDLSDVGVAPSTPGR